MIFTALINTHAHVLFTHAHVFTHVKRTEVDFPIAVVSKHAAREKSIRQRDGTQRGIVEVIP